MGETVKRKRGDNEESSEASLTEQEQQRLLDYSSLISKALASLAKDNEESKLLSTSK